MSDIEREAFEQAVTDRWSDSYSFTRFGDEDYYDEVLEGMWWAWQASRQVEGEPVAYQYWWPESPRQVTVCKAKDLPSGGPDLIVQPLYTHPARDGQDSVAVVNKASTGEYEFYPSSNLVDIPNGMHKLYTHPASRQAVSVPQQWRDTMEELAADLESEIENRRSGDLDRRIERDLIVVREARALLAEQEQGQ